MGLDTLTFSFLFLPAVLLCFYLGPARWRNGVLVAASLFFYLCNAPEWLPMMLVSLHWYSSMRYEVPLEGIASFGLLTSFFGASFCIGSYTGLSPSVM